MKKILFLQEKEKTELLIEINKMLETKNRLLKLVITNSDKKTTASINREKKFRYEEKIILLEKIRGMVISCNSRDQLKKINSIIDYYNSIN